MTRPIDIAFSSSVRAAQERKGSRRAYADAEMEARITEDLAAFVAERDSFYLATASAAGQPYVQHRGGPKGFLKVLDESTLGFADFKGNRQYISVGNLAENPRVFLFLMDYATRQRIKIWGTAEVIEDDAALLSRLRMEGYRARPEQAIVIRVEAWDANCPQHIPRKIDESDVRAALEKRDGEIAYLEAQRATLERRVAALEAELAAGRITARR